MKPVWNKSGFTLIETLVTMVVFVIGILAVTSIQLSSFKGNKKAGSLTFAGSTASNISERLRNLPFDDSDLTEGLHGPHSTGRFWAGWYVMDDTPYPPLTSDTDGRSMDPVTLCKTIEIVIFRTREGFDDRTGKNRLFTCGFIKTRSL